MLHILEKPESLTWEEARAKYPDQWLGLTEYQKRWDGVWETMTIVATSDADRVDELREYSDREYESKGRGRLRLVNTNRVHYFKGMNVPKEFIEFFDQDRLWLTKEECEALGLEENKEE